MKYNIYTIRDHGIDAYLRPFYAVATGQATRVFCDEINRTDSEMHRHPEDYDLYTIGRWDDETAQTESLQPQLVIRGKDAIQKS